MKTNSHKKNFALRLALKRRQTWTRKWPIKGILLLERVDVDVTNRKLFSVVCTLIDNDIRHLSGQNLFDKSTDNGEPLSICFLPQYSTRKKVFISERDQNHDTEKGQALSITFSQYDWFISQNEVSWLAITLLDKLTQA